MKIILLALFLPFLLAFLFGKLVLVGAILTLKLALACSVFLVPFLFGYLVGKGSRQPVAA